MDEQVREPGRGYSLHTNSRPRSGFTEADIDVAAKDGFTEGMVRERDRRIHELEGLLKETYEAISIDLETSYGGVDLLRMIKEQIEGVMDSEQLLRPE